MKKIIFASTIFIVIVSCNDKPNSDKENEVLKREIEVLKREKNLIEKEKSQGYDTVSRTMTYRNSTNEVKTDYKKPSTEWTSYNHEYGFNIELPHYFKVGSLTASGMQYYITDFDDQIMLSVQTNGGSQIEFLKSYSNMQNTTTGIDYKVLRGNWYVISGENDGEIFYYKEVYKNNWIYTLMITYPQRHKDLMDIILPRISTSFQ